MGIITAGPDAANILPHKIPNYTIQNLRAAADSDMVQAA